jgi:hypothetical protein
MTLDQAVQKLKLLAELNKVTSHSDDTDDYEWYMKDKLAKLEAEL